MPRVAVLEPYVSLGGLVRERRKASGLSVRALSDASGVAPSTVSRIENGRFTPTYETAVRLAQVLNIDLTQLPSLGPTLEDYVPKFPLEWPGPRSLEEATSPLAVRIQLLKRGNRKNLRKIACAQPFQALTVLRGEIQVRARDGSRILLRPGTKLDCRLLRSDTFFAVAVQESELLWIG
jgi:transcriptional regulator with XRE-family HTH domain